MLPSVMALVFSLEPSSPPVDLGRGESGGGGEIGGWGEAVVNQCDHMCRHVVYTALERKCLLVES